MRGGAGNRGRTHQASLHLEGLHLDHSKRLLQQLLLLFLRSHLKEEREVMTDWAGSKDSTCLMKSECNFSHQNVKTEMLPVKG